MAKLNKNPEAKVAESHTVYERDSLLSYTTAMEGLGKPMEGSKKRDGGTVGSRQRVHVTYRCRMWPYVSSQLGVNCNRPTARDLPESDLSTSIRPIYVLVKHRPRTLGYRKRPKQEGRGCTACAV
jgi:hypothetical protein